MLTKPFKKLQQSELNIFNYNNPSTQLGILCICVFFTTFLFHDDIANNTLVLAFLCLLKDANLKDNKERKRLIFNNPIFYVSIIINLYLLLHTIIESKGIEWEKTTSKAYLNFIRYNSIFFIAWWLSYLKNSLHYILLLIFSGLLIKLCTSASLEEYLSIMNSNYRYGFGYEIYQASLFWAIAICGLVAYFWQFIFKNNKLSWPLFIIWLLLFLLATHIVFVAQTRSVWFAMFITIPILFTCLVYQAPLLLTSRKRQNFLFSLIIITLLTLSTIIIFIFFKDIITLRLLDSGDSIFHLMKIEKIDPNSSLGLRLPYYQLAIELWQQRPFFGWDIGFNDYSSIEDQVIMKLPHFHNTYLEILVRLGGVGFLLIVSLLLMVIYQFIKQYQQEGLSLYVFIFCSLIIIAMWCLTEWLLFDNCWRYIVSTIIAIMYVYGMKKGLNHVNKL